MTTPSTRRRRLLTIPVAILLFIVVTVALPALLALAAAVDLVRALASRTPPTALRLVVFLWLYLLGEMWALAALAWAAVLPDPRSVEVTFRLQGAWASWTFGALRRVFGLRFVVEGSEHVSPGPLVLLVRHASIIDTLLPARFVARPHSIKLRYVLKDELLVDPALDVAGNRLPNHFVRRGTRDSSAEIAAVRALGTDLETDEGVVIFPEGTRFSVEKRDRLVARTGSRDGAAAELARRFRSVLPPRPAGTLALLDAGTDVVVLAHRGLEGFARVSDFWAGAPVGRQVDVRFWRVFADRIPSSRPERIEWLYRLWAEVDAWVSHERTAGVPGHG